MGVSTKNWAGNQRCLPQGVHTPTTTAEVAAIVRTAAGAGERVKVIGGAHSFTDIAMTDGNLLSLDGMNRVLGGGGPDGLDVTVQAGIRLYDLNDELAARGLAMPNLGDIDQQSIAGAIATATHGTGAGLGNLATTVVGMEIVTGDGSVRRTDEHDDSDLLSVARVGLGALGIVTEVTLRCVPTFNLHAVETIEPLAAVTANFDQVMHGADHVEFFWMPGARRCQVKRNTRTDRPAEPQSKMAYIRDKWIAENLAFGTVCRVGRRYPKAAPRIAKLITSAASERELIDRSDRIFSSPRHVRFVEMEYGIPLDAVPEAIERVGALVSSLPFPPLFPIEVRVSAADDIPLSTANGRPSGWIAVHQYIGTPYESYFQGVESIMDDYDGRPHWGKLHFQTAATLSGRYPEWQRFQNVRARLDPMGTFANAYTDRVLGPVNDTAID
ncbi:D-arabinono-1,4-lactone oxidase [Ilumatobacter sp.]|uniref:D-arabinono-1,4-lactone oxidase n=1 Tax=Ilumatobacter sp. TaxID=1967498 RepID=UPI003C540EDF